MKKILIFICIILFALPLFATNNCLDFDGNQAEVNIPNHSSLNPGSNGLTIEAWINTSNNANNWPMIINKVDGDGYQLFQTKTSNKIAFQIYINSTSYSVWGQVINDGKWHHVVGRRNGNLVSVYKDGVETAKTVTGANGNLSSYCGLSIANSSGGGNTFIGRIDEVRIWNRALSNDEILDSMFKELDGTESNLQAYYQFNQTSGHNLPDLTSNNNNGTLHWAMDNGDWVTSYAPIATVITKDLTNVRGVWSARTSFASSIMTISDPDISGNDRIIFGHNDGGLSPNTSDVPGTINRRLNRVWRLEEYGTLTGDVKFDCTDFGICNGSDLRLLVDADGTFSDATIVTGSYSAPNFTVSGHTFEHSYYYTLASTTSDNTLPVVLTTFTAQYLENNPTLYWNTQSETDNMGWFVYRNEENDFTTSEKISEFIEGHGTTSEPHDYVYHDAELELISGNRYWYWIQSINFGGAFHRYGPEVLNIPDIPEDHSSPVIPKQYGLHQNEPNPLGIGKETTKISFLLPKTARAEIKIYNIRGELVKDLYKGVAYTDDEVKDIIWDGRDENGILQKTGIYLYQLKVDGKPYEVKRLILLR